MTFYEIAEQMFINSTNSIRRENMRRSTYEGSPALSIYDRNMEEFEKARQGQSHYSIEDFEPMIFHPSEADKVIVHYSMESGKESKEVPLEWAQSHGELDEENHTYPDDIERVDFIKDAQKFWV